MAILFHAEDVDFKLANPSKTSSWLSQCIQNNNKSLGEINYIFCSDEYLLEVNKKHLNHDYYTDIITFDNSFEEDEINADIFVSIDRVKDNAKTLRQSFENELHRVLVHGILHLLGWEDSTEEHKQEMRLEEDNQLKILEL
jgi:probable rRNA maturation factor